MGHIQLESRQLWYVSDWPLSLFFCLQMQSEVNAIPLSLVALRSCTRLPVSVAKLKSPAMMGNDVGQSP